MFIPEVAQANTDKDAPGAALGVQLTQGTNPPQGKALTVPTEVEEDGGTSLPRGKAPAVPTEGEEGGEDLPRGKAPAAPAKVDRDERAKYNGTPAWCVGRGYEPTLAHLLVTNDVRPEEVRTRAPKSISKLLSSEMPKPFGWRSGHILASAVESVARQVAPSTVDVATSKARRISMVGTTTLAATPLAAASPPVELAASTTIAATSKTPVGKAGASQSNLDAPADGRLRAETEEYVEKRRQASLLAAQLGAPRVAVACGFPRPEVWDRLPASGSRSGSEIWLGHATAYSAGLLQGVRRTLARLVDWLERNDMDDVCSIDRCEGGVLAWFVLDEQAKSRTEGLSIPNSLRNYLVSAHDNFGLKGLGVHDPAFKNVSLPPSRTPTPATAARRRRQKCFTDSHTSLLHTLPRRYGCTAEVLCCACSLPCGYEMHSEQHLLSRDVAKQRWKGSATHRSTRSAARLRRCLSTCQALAKPWEVGPAL